MRPVASCAPLLVVPMLLVTVKEVVLKVSVQGSHRQQRNWAILGLVCLFPNVLVKMDDLGQLPQMRVHTPME